MNSQEPIVIIGSACRFPGKIDTPSKLWDLLLEPKDLQSEVPKDRFNIDAFYHPDGTHPGRTNARHGYFLNDNLRAFDAPFFNIQPVEAESMDPQQRLLLETTYEALTSAGLRLQDLRGSNTAVYVGLMTHDFEVTKYQDLQHTGTYLVTGAASSIISNRLSYFFDWHGPSMTIDTACSSSLVAVHEAVQQLRSGASTVAVAAGANLILSPVSYISESKLSMLSPTGRSRMWDSAADGYARGEGICSVVLKTLSQAIRDGDTIECVIRETGINQDGRTTGITMPSHSAQETLIRETYAKAGLDISKSQNRCQFFEAHGTGTPAGDPQEAEAIATAFFSGSNTENGELAPLLVGSVKTVIGHTEGTAGLAGLMKASLAVQNGIVPPNLLFEKLSPRVAPFYKNLRITREAQQWPAIEAGQPRRASVNSFGFGGTNAHVIVEEYMGGSTQTKSSSSETNSTRGLPLVFSAKSEPSLKKAMERVLDLINTNPQLDMLDLAWTLLRKQSALPLRYSISGHTKDSVSVALAAAIKQSKLEANLGSKSVSNDGLSILGIFTGQGAQWPGMMKGLLSTIPYVKDIVAELDHSLQTLPEEYRPTWTLQQQFLVDDTASQVSQASVSQPLCCATQVVLIRLLDAAGIKFTTIVGHSSGEISCAFAAGLISASQAIRVAYLRGLTSKYADSSRGEKGAMLAAGVSFEDAQELCELEAFEGRICVAASNSPDSTTISGDEDSIVQVQDILADESKFARLLKVDKAYHSHHMHPCAAPYVKALQDCGCAVADGDESSSVAWYSSVHTNTRMRLSDVTAGYWKDNLVSPVLFMQALEEAAMEHRPLDVAIEVGCHPALKAPALSTLKGIGLEELPYTGCMQRGSNDVDAFAGALGYLWERFAALEPIDTDRFVATLSSEKPRSLSKTLPRYSWDHSRVYWSESRLINSFLHGPRPHLLLGSLSASSTASVLQWQNIFRVKDHDWMQGHGLQGQALFPAAGFVVMAMEAGIHVAGDRPIQLLEVLDLSIDKAIIFEDETSPAEVNLTAKIIPDASDVNRVTMSFSIDSCLNKETKLSTSAQGQVVITFGPTSSDNLPPVQGEHPHMIDLDINYFYRELDALGYCYDKSYRCISNMRRADSRSAGTLPNFKLEDQGRPIVLHPATMDLSFQTIMGAYSHPGDKRLRSLYVPVHIDRIAIVPGLCATAITSSDVLSFSTANTYDKGDFFAGCVEAYDAKNNNAALFHIENLVLKPLSPPTATEDHRAFTTTFWGPYMPEKLLDDPELWATEQDKHVMPIIERIIYFYIRKFLRELTAEDRHNATAPQQSYIHWYDNVMVDVAAGRHRWYEASWELDTAEYIQKLCDENWYHPHVRLAHRVNENALSTIRENSNPFSWMNEDGLLTEFYTSRLSTGPGWGYGKKIVDQIAHRFQSMDILEIGGGTAGATRSILSIPQLGFNSYTFTDISPAFFEKARNEFAVHQDRMEFRKLDISRSPEEQGFKPHSYDLVLASSVLHATPNLTETMTNVRYLLRPGGQAVILEATHKDHTRVGYLFGLFPDWWAGRDEGRVLDPFATIDEWDAIFKRTGFSGVESRTLDRDGHIFPNSLFTTRAVSSKVSRLYQPLLAPLQDSYAPLLIVGGESPKTSHILQAVNKILPHRKAIFVKQLTDLRNTTYDNNPTVLVLSEFDEELFLNIDEAKLEATKALFAQAGNVLWVTESAWVNNPRQAMTIGMLRTIRNEYPEINVQVLDADEIQQLDIEFLFEQLLRLEEWSGAKEDVLWTYDPEVYVSKGCPLLPRIKHDMPRNNRMASGRRKIFAQVSSETAPVSLQLPDGDLYLEPTRGVPSGGTIDTKQLTITSHYALAKTIRVGTLGYLHIIQGTVRGTDRKVIALSQTNTSIVDVPSDLAIELPDISESSPCALLPVVASLLAQTILSSSIVSGSSIIIFEPPTFSVEAIARAVAKSQNIRVHIVSTKPPPSVINSAEVEWIRLHPQETEEGLKDLLPPSASVLCDLSHDSSVAPLGRRLTRHIPPSCSIFRLGHFFQDTASSFTYQKYSNSEQIQLGAQLVVNAVGDLVSGTQPDTPTTPVSKAASIKETFDVSTILDWNIGTAVPARIRPVDHGKLFVPDKTYLLVGLAGSTGRALARWMVTRGARYIVLSSRRPQLPDPKWIKKIERLGGNITVLPMDVSKKDSVDAGLAQIRQGLPPIGGIAYGPLVLHDTLFRNMDISMMHPVLNAKVVGAQLLHEYFSEPTVNPLDFFIMCSSAATTGGNPGQANYNAANAYLQALAQKRRSMGLAASTIHIGAVMGIGYLATREEKFDLQSVSDMDPLGEAEFCTLVAEAVVSGRPTSAALGNLKDLTAMSEIDIGTGIPELHAKFTDSLVFYSDPRFGNLKVPEKRDKTSSGSKTSVKEQLLTAATLDDARQIIIDGMCEKLRGTLHLSADEHVDPTTPLIDQGVDSLGAITVASWFSNQLFLDVPILKVLGGASVAELSEEAVGRLPSSAIPLIADAGAGAATSDSGTSVDVSESDSGAETPISVPSMDDEVVDSDANAVRRVPLGLGQEYSWKLQQQLADDPTIFHNTVGLVMEGNLDLKRLSQAVTSSFNRHAIFRTAFRQESGNDDQAVQVVLKAATAGLQCVEVADQAAAEEELKKLETEQYDLAAGETFKIVDFYWASDRHLLVIAYHRLAGDGSTTDNLFVELTQLYNGTQLPAPPQYPDFVVRQRSDIKHGRMDGDIAYWKSMYTTLPAVLPPLPLPQSQKQRPSALAWQQHAGSTRLSAVIAQRIKESARRLKATPMHFYLAAYKTLLALLTGQSDLVIGIADTNRSSIDDISTMGFFANMLPIRMEHKSDDKFADVLVDTKDRMRQAMLHSAVPYSVTLERLGLSGPDSSSAREMSSAPLFQAVFDYRQGERADSGKIGDASIVKVMVSRERTPHDVVLEMADDPTREPLITVKLQSSLYGPQDPQALLKLYESVLAALSVNTALRVEDIKLNI